MPTHSDALLTKPFRFYFKQHRRTVIIALTSLLITNALETRVPWLVGIAIDKITGGQPFTSVARTVGLILLITIVFSTTRYLWRIYWGRFHHQVAEDLRDRVFQKYTELSSGFFRRHKVGELISLIAHDVNSFRMGIGPGMLVLVDGLFYSMLILPTMFAISPSWTIKTMILMPFVPLTVWLLEGRIHQAYHRRQDRFAEMSGSAQEIVSGIRVVKCFAQEDNQTRSFNQFSQAFQNSCNEAAAWDAFFPPTLELPVAVGSAILLILGAPEVMRGAVSLGSFFAFYQYVQRMIWPMEAIGVSVSQIQEGRASFSRLKAVLETKSDVPDNGRVTVENFETLEVRGLTFCYPGRTIHALDNVSFEVQKGQTLGMIGETGSGKSTLVELLTRQYPAPPQTIFINGHAIEDIRLSSLRSLIAVVPQEAFLFTRRVSENLAFSQEVWEEDDVSEAAEAVKLRQEIEGWPEQYDSMVGERGVNLSGGQKQRMTLARALMKSADLIVLDDSLSAVDAKTERWILSQLKAQSTSIIVSHRLASLNFAQKILVLKEGRVEAFGSPQDLERTSKTYTKLRSLQEEATLP